MICDWPPPLGTVVRQCLHTDVETGYETWSHAYTVVEHRDGPDGRGGEMICCCLGEDIGGHQTQLFFNILGLDDGSVKVESVPEPIVPRVKLGRRLEL